MRSIVSILAPALYGVSILSLVAMAAPRSPRTTVVLGPTEVIAVEAVPAVLADGPACPAWSPKAI